MMTTPTTIERRAAVRGDETARLERMIEIRAVEDRVSQLFASGDIRGTTHLGQGQEAVAVGLAAAAEATDVVTCTYRGHGLALALGLTPLEVVAEIMGRSAGCIRGLGGSMHMSGPEVGLLPTFAIVGAGLPVAVGAAMALRRRTPSGVALAVFGDGASNIGAFHESLNMAAVMRLPVVFVCENNLYGEYSPLAVTTSVTDIAVRAGSYGMRSAIVDGQDVAAVIDATASAIADARAGAGPTLLEMKTYRYSGHSRTDPAKYRPEGELERWQERDPIRIAADRLVAGATLTDETLAALHARIEGEVRAAAEAAQASAELSWDEYLDYAVPGRAPAAGSN